MENIAREEEQKRLELRQNGASTIIAKAYKLHRLRVLLKRLLYWHHMEVTVRIQRMFRGFIQRRKFKRMVVEKNRRERRKKLACLIIQRVWRGHRERVKYRVLVEERQRELAKLKAKRLIRLEKVSFLSPLSILLILLLFFFLLGLVGKYQALAAGPQRIAWKIQKIRNSSYFYRDGKLPNMLLLLLLENIF